MLELTVVDRDPVVATVLADRLAQSVILVRLTASQRETPTERDQQLLEGALKTASGPDVATLSARVDSLYAQRATLVQEKLAYEAADKQLPYPQVVEPAAAQPVPSRRPLDVWWADFGPARGSASAFHRESVVNVSQLATVDREQLVERPGTLGAGFMRQVDSGLSLVLGP